MNAHHLHALLIQFRFTFLTYFTALTDDDLVIILQGPSESLLEVLQQRYDYTREQAKGAWNEFVLRHIDGRHPSGDTVSCRVTQSPEAPFAQPAWQRKAQPVHLYAGPLAKVYPMLWPSRSICWWRQLSQTRAKH
jgi:hypothetical protein